jgi:hypothetical protein
LLPEEPPPDGSGQFTTDFSRHTIPYAEILSGGPPKDGIPAIDAPQFVSVAEADAWLEPIAAWLTASRIAALSLRHQRATDCPCPVHPRHRLAR